MEMTKQEILSVAGELFGAYVSKTPIKRISARFPSLTTSGAYAIQSALLEEMSKAGYTKSGKKIGLTSKAMQQLVGIDEPDYGYLFHQMYVQNEGEVKTGDFIIPRVEAEFVFMLGKDLAGENITTADVAAATRFIVPALEIIDNRAEIEGQNVCDSIADNAAFGAYVMADVPYALEGLDLKQVGFVLEKNGRQISTGTGAAVMGDPLVAVAWLANRMALLGDPLRAGELVLSGSMIAAVPVEKGDYVRGRYGGLCDVCVHIV